MMEPQSYTATTTSIDMKRERVACTLIGAAAFLFLSALAIAILHGPLR